MPTNASSLLLSARLPRTVSPEGLCIGQPEHSKSKFFPKAPQTMTFCSFQNGPYDPPFCYCRAFRAFHFRDTRVADRTWNEDSCLRYSQLVLSQVNVKRWHRGPFVCRNWEKLRFFTPCWAVGTFMGRPAYCTLGFEYNLRYDNRTTVKGRNPVHLVYHSYFIWIRLAVIIIFLNITTAHRLMTRIHRLHSHRSGYSRSIITFLLN